MTADFITALTASLADATFVKLALGHYKGSEPDLKKIDIRRIIVKREEKLSFTYHYKTRDIVKNYAPSEATAKIREALKGDFLTARLFTTAFDLIWDGQKKSLKKIDASHTQTPTLNHDQQKNRHVNTEGKYYLRALNIVGDDGKVFKTAHDKYRQIDKYIEILSGLIKPLPENQPLNIVDMGAGKGYLTFALYDYITSVLKRDTTIRGVESRKDLVDLCNKIAKESQFKNLNFVEGSIQNYNTDKTNILIALHACDTATDDAIHKGISANADLIVVAPCCHKQIRREIEKTKTENDLEFLTRHGIFMERQAEMITDGMRGLILEHFGYNVKIFEFISDAHTAKNVMIVAEKNRVAHKNTPALLGELKSVKDRFGIGAHHLERLTGLAC